MLKPRSVNRIENYSNKNVSIADMFYVFPALVTASYQDLAYFIDIEDAVFIMMEALEKGKVKLPKDGISDSLVASYIADIVRKQVGALKEVLDKSNSEAKEQTNASLSVEKALMDTIRPSKVFTSLEGVRVDISVQRRDGVKQFVEVGCYSRGHLRGKVELDGFGSISTMLCDTANLKAYEVINVLLKIKGVKDNVETNVYLSKLSSGEERALIFGTHNKPQFTTLEALGIQWDDIVCYR